MGPLSASCCGHLFVFPVALNTSSLLIDNTIAVVGIHDLADRMTRPTNDTFYHKYNATSCVGLKNGNHIQDSVTDIYIYNYIYIYYKFIYIYIVKLIPKLLAPHCSCNM